ncbi:MAG: preprotein translocase subunit YajC [Verrucomicrobiota bacterium]
MLVQFGMIGVMMVIFWVMLIRPQQKRAKEQATLLKSLKPGDKVATSAGIIGVVVSLKENTVTLRSADTKLEVTKNSISDVTERAAN